MKADRPPVDWVKVRERLARATASTESALAPSPERGRQIMDERARVLSQRSVSPARPGETIEVLAFTLGAERYAIEARYVREVIRPTEVTPFPGARDVLIGLINLRGEVLPFVDLQRLFAIEVRARPALSWAIVLGKDTAEFGVPADAVHETLAVPTDSLLKAAEAAAGVQRDFQRGVTEQAMVVLDGATLLADRRLFFGPDAGTLQR